ncbi:MAG: tripartite tricarboxylate transporter substrate binding protein [Burkholderiales bacterium]
MKFQFVSRTAGSASLIGVAFAFISSGISIAQTYPVKPVRIIVPQSAGGSTDLVARPLAKVLGETMGQNFFVENRPGAGSIIGSDAVAKAAPDGYTLLMVAASFSINPSVYRKLPFDAVADFSPITQVSAFPNILVVQNASPIKTVQEFLTTARAQPGKFNYASSGVGTGTHLSMEMMKYMAKLDIVHVPYKGGAPAVNGLLGGQVQVNLATISTALPHVKAGALRALAVSTGQRWPSTPDLPTLAEAGLKGYDYASWVGVFAPAKTPAAIVNRLWNEAAKAARNAEMKAIFAQEAAEPIGNSPEQFTAIVEREIATWKKVVEAAGIKPE